MKFSLILCTINRVKENEIFLNSLLLQTHKNFEVILVDQNNDDRILPLVNQYKTHFNIIHIKSLPGLSKSRNIGLKYVSGDFIAFPDDDCIYTDDLLEKVDFFLTTTVYDGVCARQKNSLTNGVVLPHKKSKKLTPKDAFTIGSISIFIRNTTLIKIGFFDEMLGLGTNTPFLGAEDAELLIRAMKKNHHFYYDENIIVLHPAVNVNLNTKDIKFLDLYKKRFIGNGAADYYIYLKYFPLKSRLKLITNNIAMMIIHLLKNESKLFQNHLFRIKGFLITMKYFKSI